MHVPPGSRSKKEKMRSNETICSSLSFCQKYWKEEKKKQRGEEEVGAVVKDGKGLENMPRKLQVTACVRLVVVVWQEILFKRREEEEKYEGVAGRR